MNSYNGNLVLFGGLHNKLYEKNDLYIYSESKKAWILLELESITKKELDLNENNQNKKPKDVSRILINNNNFSIFSKHIKNSLSLSPLKKNSKNKQSLTFERRENNENAKKDTSFLSPEYDGQKRNLSSFNSYSHKAMDSSPSVRNLKKPNGADLFSSGSRNSFFDFK